jgi:hypothetical protein
VGAGSPRVASGVPRDEISSFGKGLEGWRRTLRG